MRGQLLSTPMVNYTVQTITTPAGTVVNEYLTLQGQVFAVTWDGPVPPNLQQLFGSYFSQYHSALAARSRSQALNHTQVSVKEPDLVVQAFGHLRHFQGLAYIPSLVPAGVSIDQLQ